MHLMHRVIYAALKSTTEVEEKALVEAARLNLYSGASEQMVQRERNSMPNMA